MLETGRSQMDEFRRRSSGEPRRFEINLTCAGSRLDGPRKHSLKPFLRIPNEIPATLIVFVGDFDSVLRLRDDFVERAEPSEQRSFDACGQIDVLTGLAGSALQVTLGFAECLFMKRGR